MGDRIRRSLEFEAMARKRCTSDLAAKVIGNRLRQSRETASNSIKKANAERAQRRALSVSGVDDGAMSVELTYVGTNVFPRTRGAVGFVSPKFDVPLKNAH